MARVNSAARFIHKLMPRDRPGILTPQQAFDVAKFAEQFGGGGHARASGLKVNGNFDEAYEQVVSAMREQLRKG